MIIEDCPVVENRVVGPDTFVLTFLSHRIAKTTLPGQFVNVRCWAGADPLLRRPFSVYHIKDDRVSIVFNKVGRGTAMLSEMREGQTLDVLGPLGKPFSYRPEGISVALLVGGGLGVAPLPMLVDAMKKMSIPFVTLLGARTKAQLIPQYLEDLRTATDDGSEGFSGNVVDLASIILEEADRSRMKIFGCGPTPMLRALSDLAGRISVPCEISLEGPMGCGFGICQGCPVRLREGEKEYALMCCEGPVFDARQVTI
jgi:dihydroorotate dehydrogenase electron transfer subunit